MIGHDTSGADTLRGARDLTRDVVAFTRHRTKQYNRARSSLRDLFIDVYSNALALACVATMAASLVFALRDEIAGQDLNGARLTAARWQVLPAEFRWMALTYLALIGILLMARRLGPVTVSRAEAAWWLPLPIDRRPMVLPPFRRRLVAFGAAASIAYLPFSLLTGIDRSAWAHAISAGTFGVGVVLAVTSAAALQLNPQSSRLIRAVCFVGFTPVAVLPFLAPAIWPLVVVLIGAVILIVYVLPRAGDVDGADLQRGGSVSGHAGASVFFMDFNELRRALAAAPRLPSSRRGSRFYAWPTRWAFSAVVRADIVVFLRLQPPPTGPVVWLVICVCAALITPALPAVLQLGVILIGGCVTAAGTGTVARRTAVVAGLDALVPVSSTQLRCSRMLMPALTMAAWMGALTAVFVVLGSTDPSLMLLGVIAGLGMGAGAVRAATRPPTDWTTPPVETPFGSIPRDQASSLLRGTDMTVLAMIPVLLTLYLGTVHPWLILTQCIASLIAITVQASTPTER
ncbi:DUF6297 family protein [Arthrobacter sp. Br18]|uniref:DUF6297 family protein n=1 Tax=Arthrobacter sp. Br18 TaxID=1312954 RepID=UPI0012DDC33B|nr:DUF6297 family protein [Arthrobacter sp. Br18]